MKNKRRKITPHKGGRSQRFYGRCTTEVSQMAAIVKEKTGLSDGDIYERKVRELYNALKSQ